MILGGETEVRGGNPPFTRVLYETLHQNTGALILEPLRLLQQSLSRQHSFLGDGWIASRLHRLPVGVPGTGFWTIPLFRAALQASDPEDEQG